MYHELALIIFRMYTGLRPELLYLFLRVLIKNLLGNFPWQSLLKFTEVMYENAEVKAENIEIKTENAKLKACFGRTWSLTNLEQRDKDKEKTTLLLN